MTDIAGWWDSLDEAGRDAARQSCASGEADAGTVRSLSRFGLEVAGSYLPSTDKGLHFVMPSVVCDFVERQDR